MGVELDLELLAFEPFYHRYSEKFGYTKLTFFIWRLLLGDLKGNKVGIPFYVTKGDGHLLLGNCILENSGLINYQTTRVLIITFCVFKGLDRKIVLPIYATEGGET